MNSFTGKPELTTLADITNDGFFPNLAMADLVTGYRVSAEYDNTIIRNQLVIAMINVNGRLAGLKSMVIMTHSTLANYCDAHPEKIDDQDTLLTKYQEAVFAYAKSLIIRIKPTARKQESETLAKEVQEDDVYWQNRSTEAVTWLIKKLGLSTIPSSNLDTQVFLL